MENFKYFDLGYPEYPVLPMYGLYQPIFDCFIAVAPSLPIANKLQSILSSRYTSQVICLNTAENFKYNLMDNGNCQQWTVENKNQIVITKAFINNQVHVPVKLSPSIKTIDWDMHQEKQWILICLYWIKFFNSKIGYFKNYNLIDTDLKDLLEAENLNYDSNSSYSAAELQIMKLLYLGRDVELIEQQINILVNQYNIDITYA
jgi:hypothetical protein